MESIFKRHLNLTVLVGVLFAQIIGLAAQVKRPSEAGPVSLVRLWVVSAVTPVEKGVFGTGRAVRNFWGNYIYLRGVRQQNEELLAEVQRLRLEELRLTEDTAQARRLQALLGFKEQFVSQTLPAQVISTTGSEFSKGIYIDKGADDGVKTDVPVITPDGIVGKTLRVYPHSSLVLEISDPTSGAGVILQKSRLQGILKGTPDGEVTVHNIMSDEKVEVGEQVLTSGGDGVFPKGMPVGRVSRVSPAGTFLNITVHPAAELERIEEVLVVTKISERIPDTNQAEGLRAVDILAQRLPTVPKAATPPTPPASAAGAPPAAPRPNAQATPVPANATPVRHVTAEAGTSAAPKPQTNPATAASTPGVVLSHPREGSAAPAGTGTASAVSKPAVPSPAKTEAPSSGANSAGASRSAGAAPSGTGAKPAVGAAEKAKPAPPKTPQTANSPQQPGRPQ